MKRKRDNFAVPGSSHDLPTREVLTPTSPRKRRKKSGESDDVDATEEKRCARFKKACPKTILERVDRVMSQRCARFSSPEENTKVNNVPRFFMVDRMREGDELREEFSVLGSTGNVRLPSVSPVAFSGIRLSSIRYILS